jgi:hypothetical protein
MENWWVGLAMVPALALLQGAAWMGDSAISLSQLSEELLRGDRLPMIPFPDASAPAPENQ